MPMEGKSHTQDLHSAYEVDGRLLTKVVLTFLCEYGNRRHHFPKLRLVGFQWLINQA